MKRNDLAKQGKLKYDISIIRTQIRIEDIRLRGQRFSSSRLRGIKKGLLTLHTLELMATNIYRFQITKKVSEFNRQLIAAMGNEMTHSAVSILLLNESGFCCRSE